MPATNAEYTRYCCLTCGTTYMVVNGQWTLGDPIIDLHIPYEHKLDESERH